MLRLLVMSPKGGSGKSTLARTLAPAAALTGLSVAVADADSQKTTLRWLQARTTQPPVTGQAMSLSEAARWTPKVDLVPRQP